MLNQRSAGLSSASLLLAVALPAFAQHPATNAPSAARPTSRPGISVSAKPPTNAMPSVARQGVGIPGEVAFHTPSLDATWQSYRGKLLLFSLIDKREDTPMLISQDVFTLVLADGQTLRSSRMEASPATITVVKSNPKASATENRLAGKQAVVTLTDPEGRLKATWKAIQRDGADYIRQELTFEAIGKPVAIDQIRLVDLNKEGFRAVGTVDGVPALSDTLFIGVEHPMATNRISGANVKSLLDRKVTLQPGGQFRIGSVIGAFPLGQARRSFNAYLERERAHAYRSFLHYNSWYDIGYFSKYDEKAALKVVDAFGEQLAAKRGVAVSSFLFDDGWDDAKTLWGFHAGFPNGFAGVRSAAGKFHAAPGVWMSPFGGYGKPRDERIKNGVAQGFETNASGFALSAPKYYQRFHDTALGFVKQGVNQFKFDGIGAGADSTYPGSVFGSDFEAAIQLIRDLRAAKPDLFVNLTTGTWPSPFWVFHADSIWRGGEDHEFAGKGPDRQRWITYRDGDTYSNVVQGCSLYPLNALMTHGLIYAHKARSLSNDPSGAFTSEVRSYFGSGTQLQELYVTPALLKETDWDVIAESAKWSAANVDVLVDTHWIGGNPYEGAVYGWAAWSPRKGCVTLRNPSDQAQDFSLDIAQAFELPAGAPAEYALKSPWAADKDVAPIAAKSGSAVTLSLKPFEVVTLDAWLPNAIPAPTPVAETKPAAKSATKDVKPAAKPAPVAAKPAPAAKPEGATKTARPATGKIDPNAPVPLR